MSRSDNNTHHCSLCGDDEVGLLNDPHWGWCCDTCKQEYDQLERATDWDSHEAHRRQKLAEANEY